MPSRVRQFDWRGEGATKMDFKGLLVMDGSTERGVKTAIAVAAPARTGGIALPASGSCTAWLMLIMQALELEMEGNRMSNLELNNDMKWVSGC